jgi:two-component system phosphate regulon sensor histidine kinase PhoR
MSGVGEESLEALRIERDQLKARLAEREQQLARTEADLRRAVAESYALYLTSLDITSQLDLKSTLSSILRRATLLANADGGLVFLLDPITGELVVSAEMNTSPSVMGLRVRSGEGFLGEVLLTGRSIVLDDYQTWSHRLPALDALALRAVASLPLRWQGKVIGVLSLHHNRPGNVFTLDDLDSLQHVTVQAAIAIHNAKLYTQEKARNQQLASLYQAATRITSSLDLDAVLRTAAESLMAAVDVPACTIYEVRGNGLEVLAAYAVSGMGRVAPITRAERADGHGPSQHILKTGLWMVLQRDDPAPYPAVAAYMDRYNVYSILFVPILLGQRVIGLVELYETRHQRRFAPADIDTAQALAAQIGVAIRHAELHHQLGEQRISEQAALLALTRRLLETTERQQVAEIAVQAIAEAFAVTHVGMLLPEGEVLKARAVLGWDMAQVGPLEWRKGTDSGISYAALAGEMIVIEDATFETRFPVHPLMISQGMRSAMIAPMRYEDQVVGLASVYRPEPYGFSEDDIRLFSLLAYQIAVALERARLFESVQAYTEILEERIDDRIREIRAAQERTEAIFQATGEALVVFDRDGRIQRVNRAFEMQHRCTAESVIGRTGLSVFGVDLTEKAPPADGIADGSNVWRGEMELPRQDGTLYHAAVTLSRVEDPAGPTLHIVGSLRDISYLKELDRMKDRFVSTVSHELRTPLANMKLYVHLLANGFEERRPQYLATLQRETTRLQQLIEDLLLLSRLESNTLPATLAPVNMNELVGTLVSDRMMLAESRGLDLQCSLHPTAIVTMADEKMISQALTNLLANAMNYTPAGGRIHVSMALEAQDSHPMIIIHVRDTGLGITPDDQARMFERFYRGKAAQDTGAAGTGLGMAIVKEVIDRHSGEIDFESALGNGSVFTLRLPWRPPAS